MGDAETVLTGLAGQRVRNSLPLAEKVKEPQGIWLNRFAVKARFFSPWCTNSLSGRRSDRTLRASRPPKDATDMLTDVDKDFNVRV